MVGALIAFIVGLILGLFFTKGDLMLSFGIGIVAVLISVGFFDLSFGVDWSILKFW